MNSCLSVHAAEYGHAVSLLESIRLCNRELEAFEFGIYRYTPQTIVDDRTVVTIAATEKLRVVFSELVTSLNHDQELAVHSRVRLSGGTIWHLPMVDLIGHPKPSSLLRLFRVCESFGSTRLALVDSGRSFHVYGLNLMKEDCWTSFAAQLLLLNSPDEPAWIDTRWIGHRLLAGYGALRLTCRSPYYASLPSVIGLFDASADHSRTLRLLEESLFKVVDKAQDDDLSRASHELIA